MINKEYIDRYINLFRQVLDESPGVYDEAGLPAYVHANRLMSWLFWTRIRTAVALAGDTTNSSVLDFGCGAGVLLKYLHDAQCKITCCENQFPELTARTCSEFNIPASIERDLFNIQGTYDYIFALDVLEHIQDIRPIINKFISLSHKNTIIVLSGPTESLFYKMGRWLAGFEEHFHVQNIYDIEKTMKKAGLAKTALRRLFPPVTLFRISTWKIALS